MTFTAAIEIELIAAIRVHCGCDATKARDVLKTSRAAAKSLGLPIADYLKAAGFVS